MGTKLASYVIKDKNERILGTNNFLLLLSSLTYTIDIYLNLKENMMIKSKHCKYVT